MYLLATTSRSPLPRRQVWRSSRLGAALVEFALVAPIMFGMIFGIIELARAYMVVELLTEAARKGCRVAVVPGTTSTQIKTAAKAPLTAVGINAESVGVEVNGSPIDSVDPSTAASGSDMTIVVSVPVTSISWIPNTRFVTGSLTGQFTLRRQ